jgi:hypothetical protein
MLYKGFVQPVEGIKVINWSSEPQLRIRHDHLVSATTIAQ